jgi:hypothetical protein
MSAYLLYQNAMRDTFKLQNPGMTFGQLAKYTSAMYAEMPPHEKEAWVARAEADKTRYLHELSQYVPPPGYDAKGDALAGPTTSSSSSGRSKGHRDPNAPKRNMSAYLMYQNCMRDQFKSENPGMTFGQLAKYTSHMYKSLTPQEKARWETHANEDKIRYETEMASYVPPPGYDSQGNVIDQSSGGTRKYNKKEKDANAPKRARGSFVFFTFEMRPQILKEYPGIKFTDMGTLMGERWRALTPDQKKRYEDMANEDKKRFTEEMQTYTANKVAAAPPPAAPAPAAKGGRGAAAAAAAAGHPPAAHHYPPPPAGYDPHMQQYQYYPEHQYGDPNAPQYAYPPEHGYPQQYAHYHQYS